MDVAQFSTIMITMIAGVMAIYKFIRDDMKLMNAHHREGMKIMDEKFIKIDEKWECLFERLLVQDKQSKSK